MLGDIVGYVMLKNKTKGVAKNLSEFEGKSVRALEINEDTKSVLVLNSKADELGMFDFEDIRSYFKCSEHLNLLMPPNLHILEKMAYYTRVMSYPQNQNRDMNFIKNMVIGHSIHKGVFTDYLYFNFASESVLSD